MNKEESTNNRTMVVKRSETDTALANVNLLDEKGIAQAEFFLKKILTRDRKSTRLNSSH